MPVGRFVLDVHGESRATWAANDALCAALQIINHLQDCGKDYRTIDRVYIPLDTGLRSRIWRQTGPVRNCARSSPVARARARLLDEAAGFSAMIRDRRLAAEVAVIHRLARDLVIVSNSAIR
jgi:phytoene/squalene synthetase